MNTLEEARISDMESNGAPRGRRTVYIVPTEFDQTPTSMAALPRMDRYVTNYHIVQWIGGLYQTPSYGWASWAEHDVETADFYFSPPYVEYAQTNLGYGPANVLFSQEQQQLVHQNPQQDIEEPNGVLQPPPPAGEHVDEGGNEADGSNDEQEFEA